ncbi:cupin domain-containing protein [Catenulispora pinisilvae]|uniref:cupin domain-containing protein n=1 Tax=Catenulispora pinisilvae TaxID=2705253 RepID=UPI001891BB5D
MTPNRYPEDQESHDVIEEADAIAAHYGLEPLPAEGGRFRQTWAGPRDASGRPQGTAILMLLTSEPGDFSAMHRLPIDEVWHFYRGDLLDLLLLHPDGRAEVRHLGDGQLVQTVVPAGCWMGARVTPGGDWSLFGTTMAPGFMPADFEGGDADELARRYPREAELIRALSRADARMPEDLHGPGNRRGDTGDGPAATSS